MNTRTKSIVIVSLPFIVLMMVLWPAPAHALSILEIVGSPMKSIFLLFIYALQIFQSMLAQLMLWLADMLTAVLMQPYINYGGPAVYVVWKIFRDMCNSLFIVFFVLIAFSTIFNSIWKGASTYYYRNALMGVITAAVLINFSLPIGQTMVWAGNQAGVLVSGLMTGTNINGQIITSLRLGSRAKDEAIIPPNQAVPDEVTPLDQQGDVQRAVTTNWSGEAKEAYEECIRTNTPPTMGGCFALAARINAPKNVSDIDQAATKPSFASRAARKVVSFFVKKAAVPSVGGYTVKVAAMIAQAGFDISDTAAELQKLDTTDLALKFGSTLLNVFLMLLMILSFLCVIAFMILRLPIIWFYLATSAIAFFMIAVPGSDRFKKWWGNMIGYNIFGPLYLLAIYVGLFVLSQQNTLLTGLKNAAWYDGFFGVILFYLIAAGVFVGGAGAAWKFAFSFSDSLKEHVGSIAGKIGMDEKSMFGLKSGAQKFSRVTGATSAYEGAQARVTNKVKSLTDRGQKYQDTVRARFEGGRAMETLQRKNIEEKKKSNKESGRSNADLRSDLQKTGPAYFAAASQLLEAGELSPAEMSDYVAKASSISPAYGQAAREQVNKKIIERAKEKKFKTSAEALSALDQYAPDPKDSQEVADSKVRMRDSLLKSLEKNQPLVAADMVAAGHYPNKRPEDIIKANFGALENKDIGEVVERLETGRLPKDKEFTQMIAGKNRKLSDHLNLMGAISDQQIQGYIFDYMNTHNIKPRP